MNDEKILAALLHDKGCLICQKPFIKICNNCGHELENFYSYSVSEINCKWQEEEHSLMEFRRIGWEGSAHKFWVEIAKFLQEKYKDKNLDYFIQIIDSVKCFEIIKEYMEECK